MRSEEWKKWDARPADLWFLRGHHPDRGKVEFWAISIEARDGKRILLTAAEGFPGSFPVTTPFAICTVCMGPGVYVWSYTQRRGEMLPSPLVDEVSDSVPPEVTRVECSLNRHGIDFGALETPARIH